MKNNKKYLAIALMCGLIVIAGIVSAFLVDKMKFSGQDKNIKSYIAILDETQKIHDISMSKYCSYAHQKYSKGSLRCDLSYKFSSEDEGIVKNSGDTASDFGWTFQWDNTVSNNKYSTEEFIKSEVYTYKDLYCNFSVKKSSNSYEYEIGCSGPAKAEWFPVKKN